MSGVYSPRDIFLGRVVGPCKTLCRPTETCHWNIHSWKSCILRGIHRLSRVSRLLSFRAATVFQHIIVDNNPLLDFIWTVPIWGERRAEFKAEERKCQEKKPQRGGRRCEGKGEKSRGKGQERQRGSVKTQAFPSCPSLTSSSVKSWTHKCANTHLSLSLLSTESVQIWHNKKLTCHKLSKCAWSKN